MKKEFSIDNPNEYKKTHEVGFLLNTLNFTEN